MKKMKSFVIAAAITAVAVVPVFASISGLVSDPTDVTVTGVTDPTDITDTEYMMGDVDNNKKIELKDAQLALKKALNLIELDAKATKAADVDGNGKVELKDAQKILRVALNLDKF